MPPGALTPLFVLGRYAVYAPIAMGGMASVHLGRQMGAAGFARTVAIKRLLPEAARNPEVLAMFTDEARLAARVCHPNVVSILDVVSCETELFLVMEYIVGESLAGLSRAMRKLGERARPEIAAGVVLDLLYGLHAAHEARAEDGTPLNVVHRDVSPHNVLVGIDGRARVLDFGIAKAAVQLHTTRENQIRGKLAYMAPEQIRADVVTRFADIYAAGVVLWELLAGTRLFEAANDGALLWRVLEGEVPALIDVAPHAGEAASAVARRALERDPARRFGSALEMARALERALPRASPDVVGAWVSRIAEGTLAARAALVAQIESATSPAVAPPSARPAPPSTATPVVEASPQPAAILEVRAPFALTPPRASMHTLTAPADRPPARRSAAPRVAVAALAALAIAGAWAVREALRAEPAPAASDAAAGPLLPASTSAALAPPVVAGEPDAPSSVMPTSGTLASDPAAAGPPGVAPGRPRGAATPARSLGSCDPPYYIDVDGIRRVKRRCLR